jgi:hypothetical protein
MTFLELLPKLNFILMALIALSAGYFWYNLKSDRPVGKIIAALPFSILLVLLGLSQLYQAFYSEAPSGVLRPANEPTPPIRCNQIPKDALVLVLGTNISYTTASHYTFLTVAGEDLLSIDREEGGITVSATLYREGRKVLAKIRGNKFDVNPSSYFQREPSDRHTLIVSDHQGQRVLYVRHINSSAIKVLGKFHTAAGVVQLDEERLLTPDNSTFTKMCFGNTGIVLSATGGFAIMGTATN